MDAHKVRWVEQQLQLLHRSSRQVRRATDVEPGIVARTLDATHLIYRKDNRAVGCPNRETLEVRPDLPRGVLCQAKVPPGFMAQAHAQAIKRAPEPFWAEGLE